MLRARVIAMGGAGSSIWRSSPPFFFWNHYEPNRFLPLDLCWVGVVFLFGSAGTAGFRRSHQLWTEFLDPYVV